MSERDSSAADKTVARMQKLRRRMNAFMRELEALNQPASQADLDRLKRMAAEYHSLAERLAARATVKH